MEFYLIHHPKRKVSIINGITVYHDGFIGNQCPFVWNDPFLHTYCHITQLKNEIGNVNFWVSAFPSPKVKVENLYCDLVFEIGDKLWFKNNNRIESNEEIIPNQRSFIEHYQHLNLGAHQFKKRRRYTLRANSEKSFQPQNDSGQLIDILPFLHEIGFDSESNFRHMTAGRGASRPVKLSNDVGTQLYEYLRSSPVKLYGNDLENLKP